MPAEFGTRLGLAARLPDQTQEIHYQAQLQRQAKMAAEQKAKMFAGDFEYNNAMNGHDNPLVKNFATGKLMEIGNYLRSNPGWETNPMQRAKYNQLIHELKDNPDLNRGMLSDANFSAWQKYQSDPKNSEIVNDPEFQTINQQWENYLKFGNQHGEEAARTVGKRSFMFVPPEEMQDYSSYLRGIAGDTEFDGHEKRYNGGQIINKQLVTDVSRDKAVQLALSGPMAKWIRKDYEKRGGDEKYGSIDKFVRTIMDPFFKGDSYHYDMVPEWMARPSNPSDSQPVDWWAQDASRAFENHREGVTTPVTASRAGAEELLRDKRGYYNLSGGEIYNPNTGAKISVKGLVTKNATSSGAQIKYVAGTKDSPPKYLISTTVRMPLSQANAMFDNYIDIADYQPWNSPSVYSKYKSKDPNKKDMFTITKDDDGNTMVEFDVWKGFENVGSTAAAYNYGNGGTKEKTVSNPAQYKVAQDTRTGEKWVIDNNGNKIERYYGQ